jgi:ankyrin repeat protein
MCALRAGLAFVLALAAALPAAAHETDQFTLPAGRQFADVGDYFTRWAYRLIDHAVRKTNRDIHAAINHQFSPDTIANLQSPDEIAKAVNREMPWAMDVIEGLERDLNTPQIQRKYPGQVVCYKKPFENIQQHAHFILDPRQLFRIWLASTFKAYGVYLGFDKIGHFTDMGMNYYRAYRAALRAGESEPQATRHAVQAGTQGLIFSERGMLGYLTAGAYSNADLAANYLGFLFYRNLTEPVRLKGQLRHPMLVRDGPYWKLANHVRPDSDFFSFFISDHLNEALNPSLYESGMRSAVRRAVQQRANTILEHYRDPNGNRRPPRYFDNLVVQLSTYYGADYGHEGSLNDLITIGNTCFSDTSVPVYLTTTGPGGTDARGRTALHRIAADPQGPSIRPALDGGIDPNTPDHDRQTPLHDAARAANTSAAAELLRHGANANARDKFNTTPLHLAAAQKDPAAAKLLIQNGANVSAKDDFGCTPLHDAARAGADLTALLLLDAGANVNATDAYGTTPLHLACRHLHPVVVALLVSRRANVNAASAASATPLHEAALAADPSLIRLLLSAGAQPAARDRRGRTPANVADASTSLDHHDAAAILRQHNQAPR